MPSRRTFLAAGLLAAAPVAACTVAPLVAAQKARGATFLLVHGAWHGGWCWQRVTPLLQARGHTVHAPTLTGLGERSHLLNPAINLSTHIDDICGELLWNDLSDVVLCGHSYGGMIITGVAERHPGRIRSIVYLDAFLPKDGQSLDDILARPQPSPDIVPTRTAISMVNAADAPWVQSKVTPQPGATFRERLKVTGAIARLSRRTYVRATKFQVGAFDASYELARSDKSWTAAALDCNHDTMLDEPAATARILIDAI